VEQEPLVCRILNWCKENGFGQCEQESASKRIPGIGDFAKRFAEKESTVRSAFDQLARLGHIYSIPSSGTHIFSYNGSPDSPCLDDEITKLVETAKRSEHVVIEDQSFLVSAERVFVDGLGKGNATIDFSDLWLGFATNRNVDHKIMRLAKKAIDAAGSASYPRIRMLFHDPAAHDDIVTRVWQRSDPLGEDGADTADEEPRIQHTHEDNDRKRYRASQARLRRNAFQIFRTHESAKSLIDLELANVEIKYYDGWMSFPSCSSRETDWACQGLYAVQQGAERAPGLLTYRNSALHTLIREDFEQKWESGVVLSKVDMPSSLEEYIDDLRYSFTKMYGSEFTSPKS
jgi:hypothetical protein